MDPDLRKKLHFIRERITKAFNDCDNRLKAIQAMDDNLSVVREASKTDTNLVPVLTTLQSLRDAALARHNTAMAVYNTAFTDVVQ